MAQTARRTFIATVVVGGVVVGALALWQLRVLLALLFLAFIIAAAMRPGIDALARHHVPRSVGIAVHYIALVVLIALFLYFVVPRAISQISTAIGRVPTSTAGLKEAARNSSGTRHEILLGIQHWLERLPSGGDLVSSAISIGTTAFEVVIGVFFTLASAAYWIFERDRAEELVLSLLPRERRAVVRDTWRLIDLKLGAFVRGELLLVVLVAAVLSTAFWAMSLPYWILVGVFAGVFELIPVIGPLAAGLVAIGVGLTVSWEMGLGAGVAVLAVRLLEDYLVMPRVLGHAVGLSPLIVLVSVFAMGLLLGGAYVLLAIPVASVVVTLVDVVLRGHDPADEDVPTVIFPAQDHETVGG